MSKVYRCPICGTDVGCIHGTAEDPDKGKPVYVGAPNQIPPQNTLAGYAATRVAAATSAPKSCYTLWYTNECEFDMEKDFEAVTDADAIVAAKEHCRGTEGLWSGFSLIRDDGKELDFQPF